MTAATLDPAATITAASTELVDELRQLVDRGLPVDELLDAVGRLTSRIRRRLNGARKVQLEQPAEPAAPKPAPAAEDKPATARPTPADKPTSASAETTPAKTVVPASTPAPKRATVTLAPLPPKPAPATTPPVPRQPAGAYRGRHRKPRRQMLAIATVPWPVLAVALVMGLLAITAGIGWSVIGGAITAGALLARARWPRLTTIRTKPRGNT